MGTDYQLWSQYLAEWVEFRYGGDIEDLAWADYERGLDPYGNPKAEAAHNDGGGACS